MAAASFTGSPVGYRPFKKLIEDLNAAGYIAVITGQADPRKMIGGDGFVTRIIVQPRLIALLDAHDLSPANYRDHFRLPEGAVAASSPIKLVSTRTKPGRGKRGTTFRMEFDAAASPAAEYAEQVRYINAYLSQQQIEGAECRGFVRHFNMGDSSTFVWNKGGRLVCVGGGYQTEKPEVREAMTINGESVVEIDIKASHLTILHALEGVELNQAVDPYHFAELPREVAKAWITMTLGHSAFHRRWTDRVKKDYAGHLQSDYPVREVQRIITSRYPLLSNWPASQVGWGDLQFLESQIIIDSMLCLAGSWQTPSLPVFDSLIVPVSKRAIAKIILKREFKRKLGVTPSLKE